MLSNGLGLAAIAGAILLGAALLYARVRTRATTRLARARTEDATRDLYRGEGKAQTRRDAAGEQP